MQPVIYADLRCLQDRDYQRRGIGYHTAALLRARANSTLSSCKMVGLVDPGMPAVPPDLLSVVDETSASINPCFNGAPAVFIDGSPMTHDTRFSLRLLSHPQVLKAAVLYDFIPLDWPGYLPTTASRIQFLAKLSRLTKFDLFFPISSYTAWRLAELVGVSGSRVKVTGASVRHSLYEAMRATEIALSPYEQAEPYFVSLGGDDRRKNTDIAVKAIRYLNLLYGRRIPLKVIGFYCDAYKASLLQAAGHAEGQGFVEFYPSIPDSEVVRLHVGAIAAICPSRIEGFSLPVPEAAVCGCPVISSTCAAQIEMITQPEALFHSEDHDALALKLEAIMNDRALRESLVSAQAHLADDFHASAVGERFWTKLESAVANRIGTSNANSGNGRKVTPRLALLSPYPPDRSDAAFYTAGIARASKEFFTADIFSNTARPLVFEGAFTDAGPVSVAPLLDARYNSIVSVLGNAPAFAPALGVFERHGGPCILHDVRLLKTYFELLGPARFCHLATTLQGRPIELEEAQSWRNDPNCTLTFLQKVIQRASPLIVQTPTHQAFLKQNFGAESHLTTCCPTVLLEDDELTPSAKTAARDSLGVAPGTFLISTFGPAASSKGMEVCILTVELLRSWGIPAELYFVDDLNPPAAEINRICNLYDVSGYIHFGAPFAGPDAPRQFLTASDASLQLRDYDFGQLSSPVVNSAGAGLPAVATADMAAACQAPGFIRTVPDRFSPLQVGEQLAAIWETGVDRDINQAARLAYLETHNFTYYCKRLVEILGLL